MTTTILPVPKSAPNFGISFEEQPGHPVQVHIDSDVAQQSLTTAAKHLAAGELVAFPTETVYGLGACAVRAEAAAKIYQAKNRPMDNPLIVHVSDRAMMMRLLPHGYQVSRVCEVLMDAFWPGPLTLLFPVGTTEGQPHVPSTVTCGQPTVGVRMPSHPIARALIALANVPIAAPSANASGRPSPTSAQHVYTDLAQRQVLRYIVDGGNCDVGVESTVVDAVTTPGEVHVLRPGGVSVESIASVLQANHLLRGTPEAGSDAVQLRVYGKTLERSAAAEQAPTTPGMKYRHYSPEARVVLVRFQPHAASLAEVLSSQLASITEEAANAHDATGARRRAGHGRIGVMCAVDSPLFACVARLTSEPLQQWAASSERVSPVVDCGPHQLCVYSLGVQSAPATAAQRLFDGLRTLDTDVPWAGEPSACDLILVEEIPDTGIGLAVMNRLQKAATGVIEVGSV